MLKVLSLFSGIGAFEKALERQDIEYQLVNYCEIDKYASKAYSLIHNVSEQMNLGDITKIDTFDLDDDIDIITHGSHCFTGDTLVLTKDGYKEIKDIKVGDYVLDHTNNYNKVVNFFNQGEKQIWEIKPMCSDVIKTTENHKFLVRTMYREWNNDRRSYDRKFKSPEWKQCKQLTKYDYLGVAINQNSIIPEYKGTCYKRGNFQYKVCNLDMTDKRLWYLCGRYLGDGWLRNRKDRNDSLSIVMICCGKQKDGQIENEIGGLFNFTKTEERTVFKYCFSNKELALFLEQFGRGAKNKKIPSFVFDLPVEYIKEILRGYWDSDGYVIESGIYKATSISKQLVYGIGQLIAKAYHRPYSIYYTKKEPTYVIENRTVKQNDAYTVSFKKEIGKQDKAFYDNGYLWIPINSIVKTYDYKNVYDIEVENSHSLTANGVIAHNCQDFSVAGKQAGGDEGSNTRSSLMWNTVDIVKHVKPKVVLWENVKNLLGKKHRHNFDSYIQIMDEAGYNNYWQVLNAKDYGIPQNRERVFIVSIRKDIDNGSFEFPKPFELELRLKDMLEDEVDEKYYLKDTKDFFIKNSFDMEQKGNGFRFDPHVKQNANISKTITTRAGARMDDNFIVENIDTDKERFKFDSTNEELKSVRLGGVFDTEKSKHQAGSVWDKDGLSPTLDTMQGGWRQPCILVKENNKAGYKVAHEGDGINISSRMKWQHVNVQKQSCQIITTSGGNDRGVVTTDYRIRKLTPRECFRLMGFDDSDFDKVEGNLSNTQLYKQAGNSIVVNVLEEIYKELFKYIKL